MLENFLAGINVANPAVMIPLVAGTGFLDGVHPCAIAILIFFIAFLLGIKRGFKNIMFLGSVYIFVIFLTYLSVGVGLFSGIMLFGQHHFMAKFGSWLLIVLGIINIKDFLFPNLPIHLRMPTVSGDKSKKLLENATLPTVIVAAFFVGLCSIPCAGGIYVAITALLASKTTYFMGFAYLILYNVMFVLPLIILLALTVNPYTLAKIAEFRQKNERMEKLVMGTAMVALGAVILLFFV
ncbi:MAG: cytochrome c biogenesis protein CcdA [Candidatus Staskawiczbacteria bacterium]|nr:cytochrome c biogenesis protein CcdA [Candidatus Staskawiczbacteria bacterium]